MDNIDDLHKHELLDRLHCIQEMFDALVFDHPASALMREELKAVSDALSSAYQKAGLIRFNTSEVPSKAVQGETE